MINKTFTFLAISILLLGAACTAGEDERVDEKLYFESSISDIEALLPVQHHSEQKQRCSKLYLMESDLADIIANAEELNEHQWYSYSTPSEGCGLTHTVEFEGEDYILYYRVSGLMNMIRKSDIRLLPDEAPGAFTYTSNNPERRRFWYRKCKFHQEYFEWYLGKSEGYPGAADPPETVQAKLAEFCR